MAKTRSRPGPTVDIRRARGCDKCREWGSVVVDGRYELCPACQWPWPARRSPREVSTKSARSG
ncbi:hypothetical protein CYQ11_19555 [Streptomyces cinnamoneus]|nr:hypothetical protein CYQ11_19555 [Streptomyces cinnamoneus]